MARHRGVLLFVVLVLVLGGLTLFAALTMRRNTGVVSETVLVFDVPSRIDESEPPLRPYSLDAFRSRTRPTVWDVVDGIDRAAADNQVRGLVLHIGDLDWGWARLIEVRDALSRFRATGKPLFASVTSPGDGEYLLATAATRVSAPPTASLYVDGLSLSALFLRGSLDKLGVTPNFAHVGEYKSAVETYTRGEMSPGAKEALDAVLDDDFQALVDSLSSARGIPQDSVRRLLDDGPFDADEALQCGLVDTLLYDAEVDTMAVHATGGRPTTTPFHRYLYRASLPPAGTRIAIVTAEGAIAQGRSRITPGEGRVLGSETLIEALQDVRKRRSVKAVVLRVDSPGGDSQASDDIWREVDHLRRTKPVVVSMSDYAASGGYYIAMGASAIVAQPGTLTGSIGIYGGKFNVLGLYRKLGLNVETLSRGRHAEMMSAFRDFSDEEAARFQQHLETFYRGFVHKVAVNRHRDDAAIDSLARGRVWTGRSAYDRGLVDALGGFDVALARAKELAGIDPGADIVVERYPVVERTFFQHFVEGMFGDDDDDNAALALLLPEPIRAWLVMSQLPAGRALAILPYTIEIR